MKTFLFSFLMCLSSSLFALHFPMPSGNSNMVGTIQTEVVSQKETFAEIARRYDVGYMELREANPEVNPDDVEPGTVLIIPTRYILPRDAQGIVVNVAEMRLYYFPPGKNEVVTYPVGVGREGEATPTGELTIIQRIKNPTWVVPKGIKEARAKEGIQLPHSIPPGPDNPLGQFALRLSNWTYLIHGTNDPLGGIGRRSSSGCLRLYPEDIAALFSMVSVGTPVKIINEPYKIGWDNTQIYLESHVPLKDIQSPSLNAIHAMVEKKFAQNAQVNWQAAKIIAGEMQGIPQVIGNKPPLLSKR